MRCSLLTESCDTSTNLSFESALRPACRCSDALPRDSLQHRASEPLSSRSAGDAVRACLRCQHLGFVVVHRNRTVRGRLDVFSKTSVSKTHACRVIARRCWPCLVRDTVHLVVLACARGHTCSTGEWIECAKREWTMATRPFGMKVWNLMNSD